MSVQMNQFQISDLPGRTMNVNPDTITARVSKDQTPALVPGDVVKYVASEVGGAPVIQKISTNDPGDGIVLYNMQNPSFAAKKMCEIGLVGTIVTMVAGSAFNRGDVYYNATDGFVYGTSGATRNGIALDIATAAGDIVRVKYSPRLA